MKIICRSNNITSDMGKLSNLIFSKYQRSQWSFYLDEKNYIKNNEIFINLETLIDSVNNFRKNYGIPLEIEGKIYNVIISNEELQFIEKSNENYKKTGPHIVNDETGLMVSGN